MRRVEAAPEDGDPAQDFTLQLGQPGRREPLVSHGPPVGVVERRDDLVVGVVEHDGAPVAVADGPGREKPARADLLDEGPVALAVDEERRREDVLLVEERLVVHEDGDPIAEHLDAAELARGQALERLEAQARALALQERLDLLGRPLGRDRERPVPEASSLASGPTSDSAQSATVSSSASSAPR